MLSQIIPFELHLTVSDISAHRQADFIAFCERYASKPLLIELSRGEHIKQPMLSKIVYSNNFEEVLAAATQLSNTIKAQDYTVERLKIEIPAKDSALLQNHHSAFDKYFEWHGKVNYIQADRLLELCKRHHVHLSRNALKNENNNRFITLREFGSKAIFEQRIHTLLSDIDNSIWNIQKQQSEYCIYDNNNFLDKGWLTQYNYATRRLQRR